VRFKDPVIGASLKKDIDGAWFDSAALHIGVMLEKRAMEKSMREEIWNEARFWPMD
jgi:hypothetical protein